MRYPIYWFAALMIAHGTFLNAQPSNEREAADQLVASEMLVYIVRNAPAADVAKTIAQLYQDDPRVRVVPDSIGNVLLVRVSPEVRAELTGILESLDFQPKLVWVEVLLVRVTGDDRSLADLNDFSGPVLLNKVKELEAAGRAFVSDRLQLVALENQRAMVQVGQTKPVVSGSTFSGRGRVNSYQRQDVGTLLAVTHRVSGNQITLELQFEKSELVPQSPAGDDGSDAVPLFDVQSTTVQSTLQLRTGEAVLVKARAVRAKDQTEETFLVLSARVTQTKRATQSTNRRERGGAQQRGSRSNAGDIEQRYARYAEGVIAKHDENGDGCLQPEEWAGMSKSPVAADVNNDGKITLKELSRWYTSGL